MLIVFLFVTESVLAADDIESYMSRTRKNDSSYERQSQSIVLKDKEFKSKCWPKLAPQSIEVFYTINVHGKASDIITFHKDVDISCLKRKMESLTFPRPLFKFYGWWLVWDGAGG